MYSYSTRARALRVFGRVGGVSALLGIALVAACSDDDTMLHPPLDAATPDSGSLTDGAVPDGGVKPACAPDVTTGGKAKNVVFFLGDGMGITTLTGARIYSVGEEGSLTIDTLPETGFVRTYSHDFMVTDSAPSMSAYMTGVKMNNNVISMSPETVADPTKCVGSSGYKEDSGVTQNGAAVTTFLELAKKAGKATGVVTTTRLTDATPAATYAHICQRNLEFDIAAQVVPGGAGYNAALGNGIDVVLGGGSEKFDKATRPDQRDLFAELTAQNYTVVRTAADLAAYSPNSGKRLFGSFTPNDMSYEVDRIKVTPAVEPSLTDMAVAALDVLTKGPNGYFLMVEGGRIDHALHATQARRAFEETVSFDRTIAAVLAKVDLANTLVVVTADHDHTLVHNGYAHRVGKTTPTNPGLLGFVRNPEPAADGTFTPVNDRDGVPYTIIGFGNGPNRVAGKRTALDETTTSGVDYRQEATFHLSSETHGGTDVSIWSTGASSEQVHGFMTNTAVFDILRCGAGL
ncbi:alkaline phosphatase [Pendulispora rubella]|uniref:Alkaline phosphatase n=1 Tax=Pendulispora rubella TaxID=2741070 RepID=A0ABZ2LGL9_9BACT